MEKPPKLNRMDRVAETDKAFACRNAPTETLCYIFS